MANPKAVQVVGPSTLANGQVISTNKRYTLSKDHQFINVTGPGIQVTMPPNPDEGEMHTITAFNGDVLVSGGGNPIQEIRVPDGTGIIYVWSNTDDGWVVTGRGSGAGVTKSTIIYRPGSPTSEQSVQTDVELLPYIHSAVANGNELDILIDDTGVEVTGAVFSAAMGLVICNGLVTLKGYKGLSATGSNRILTVQDGCQLVDLIGIDRDLTLQGNPQTLATLLFTNPNSTFFVTDGSVLTNLSSATMEMIAVPSGNTFILYILEQSGLQKTATFEIINVHVTGQFLLFMYNQLPGSNSVNVIRGDVDSVWTYVHDNTAPAIQNFPQANFLGASVEQVADNPYIVIGAPTNKQTPLLVGATTVGNVSSTVDTGFTIGGNRGASMQGTMNATDVTAHITDSKTVFGSLRNFGGLAIPSAAIVSNNVGDPALATATVSFTVSLGGTLEVVVTPPAAYPGTLKWIVALTIIEN
jgi:hypothetical protein